MICYNCGNEVTTEGTNCPFCGSPLSAAAGNQQAYNQQTYNQQGGYWSQNMNSSASMDAKTASIVCYITWIGFLIAVICGDKNDIFLKHHLNNALVIFIASIILSACAIVPFLGWIAAFAGDIFLLVCAIMGIVGALNGELKELPIISQFKIIK